MATKMIRMILSIHYSLLYPKFANRKPCPVLWYPTICLLTWYQMISWSLKLNKCHGDINLDEVLEVRDKACRLWLRWRTTFTTTPPNNNIGRSNTGKLNGYLGIKSTAMLLCLTERWTLSRRIRSEIIGAVCLLALFFSWATLQDAQQFISVHTENITGFWCHFMYRKYLICTFLVTGI